MYARSAKGRTLTLGVSGMLWNRSLVMYDRETNSLWSHILGKAMQGPLKGAELKQIPSVMTDWRTWREKHPKSTVLWMSRTSNEYRRTFYRQPEKFVLGIVDGENSKSWGFDVLMRNPAKNDSWLKQPVLVAFERQSITARLFHRLIGDRVLTFQMAGGRLTDRETGSLWEPVTGRAVQGPLAGQYLKALPAIVSYKHTWNAFHPSGVATPR